ncbi:MAG TPA: peptide chain release factor N(5)-glutamine methyltransferase [Lapillicoccus sp.]|nr:peptide chain release factor N(5)-glutamine methyltransferase [Lapillicoccus sp.]
MTELRDAVRRATMTLAEAGVASAPVDALHLAAHLRGEDVAETRRLMVLGGVEEPAGYADLVAERANRVPLQHLTGRAYFRGLELEVGPGVFVPRPETELLVDLALRSLAGVERPVVVDLATGSGAIALAVKQECPEATVYAVELTEHAVAWAVRNRDRSGLDVTIERGDARHAYPELGGTVDVVTCNPPYIPEGQVPVDPEVRDHDPVEALYGGSADGLALPLEMAAHAAELLHDEGVLVIEHAETQGATLPRALAATGDWGSVMDHVDLLGRPRCVVATRLRSDTSRGPRRASIRSGAVSTDE